MQESLDSVYVGIDIGTTAVRCVVGQMQDDTSATPSIIGSGIAPNSGMRKGVPAHLDDVASAISMAINEAERVSGLHISRATINCNGSHVMGQDSRGVIAISAANREITVEDRLRVEDAATIIQLPPNREIVQVFPKNYRLDGQDNIKDPVGMRGVRLEVDTHIVTASVPNMRSMETVLEKAQVVATHHTVSALAAAEAVLSRAQKEAGTLVIDIGASTTNMVVMEDGEVQFVGVIPMGSAHITNDLAIGLRTDLEIAELVKLECAGISSGTKNRSANVMYNQKRYDFDIADVNMITEARVEELFEFVEKELKKIRKSRKLPGGVVIVGGGSRLPGIADYAKDSLQLAARIGKLHQDIGGLTDIVQDASLTPVVGLMLIDMLYSRSAGQGKSSTKNAALSKLRGLFTRIGL